jgi:anti-sigma regulatory factor (Ser/Thr protein kinase)
VSGTSPAKARADTRLFLSRCLDIPDGFADAAVLAVSELVTNAYTAMETGPVSGIACAALSLRLFGEHLLIEVIDSSLKPPVPDFSESAGAVSGRGLAVVDSLSEHQWGYFWRTGRKIVFCKLPTHSPDSQDSRAADK